MKGNTSSPKVGVIGLGFMGSAISGNLIRDGFTVFGCDIDTNRVETLVAKGGKAASSPAEIASQSDVVLTLLPSDAAFDDVVWSPTGLLASKKPNLIVMECSTLPINLKERASEALEQSGILLLDCPISGGTRAAERDLVVYGSGSQEAFEKCLPVINGFARANYYLGEFGNGSKMKYVANLLVAIHNVSAAEALVFGMKSGLDPELVYRVICDSSGRSRMLEVRGPKMLKGDFDQASMRVGVFQKDLNIIEDFAALIHCPTPLFSCAAQVYNAALAQGRENQDTSSVFAVLKEWSRIKNNP
jgi:3-hydroxyisobutyrate dehydrogenase-like beta-hydroxyacid dehydrogenase